MSNELPPDFKCPISLEIMSDPVILSSGHTFDRTSIQTWLNSGHRTCPITKLPLPDPPTLIPNHALRSLISTFTPPPPFPNSQPSQNPQTLIQTLTSPSSTPQLKLQSLIHLSRISKLDTFTRRGLVESGAVSAILTCVDQSTLQEKALHLLLNLSLDDDSKVGLVAEGVVYKLVHTLVHGAGDSRAVSATVLTSLSVIEVNKITIGACPDVIPGLVTLLRDGSFRERKESATALFSLCSYRDNRVRAVRCGAVYDLIVNVRGGLERGVEVLGLLGKCKEGRDEMVRFDGFVEVLVGVVRNGGCRGVQYALSTLSYLFCYCGEEMVEGEGVREELYEICVGLLDDDNEKVRRNAKTLIQVLQGKRKNV